MATAFFGRGSTAPMLGGVLPGMVPHPPIAPFVQAPIMAPKPANQAVTQYPAGQQGGQPPAQQRMVAVRAHQRRAGGAGAPPSKAPKGNSTKGNFGGKQAPPFQKRSTPPAAKRATK